MPAVISLVFPKSVDRLLTRAAPKQSRDREEAVKSLMTQDTSRAALGQDQGPSPCARGAVRPALTIHMHAGGFHPPKAFSSEPANANATSSLQGRAAICTPMGRPEEDSPQRTTAAGQPVRLCAIV